MLNGMKQDPLEFIIRTRSETDKLLKQVDPQYYFIK